MSGALLYLGVLMVTFLLGIPVALGLGRHLHHSHAS